MKANFVIFGLPRSRTFWLSRFLSYADWQCGHDEIRHARSFDDIKSWLGQPATGTVETAAAPFWRLIPPTVRTIVVRRPVDEVLASLCGLGMAVERKVVERWDAKLNQIERRVSGCVSFRFEEMATEEGCARIFEHCLPYQHDKRWYDLMAPLNLQVNMPHMVRYCQAHKRQLDMLAKQARHATLRGFRRPVREPDCLTIQQEPFEVWYRDSAHLFSDHLVAVGEAPDAYAQKNIPLMRALDSLGALQITTARCNGRVFGYLMALISPSLEAPDITSATHLTFYASQEFPGIGAKLQRASIEALRDRGVTEVLFRAGTRGAGPKMGSLYRRLGAHEVGRSYLLELGH